MRALLAENGKLVANGARRTGGKVNEMRRAVYSTCNLCAKDPSAPPLWQIRARTATQDLENKRIEYRDASLDIYGVPVAVLPVFLARRPVGEAGERLPDPLDRLVEPSRRLRDRALLLGDRRRSRT